MVINRKTGKRKIHQNSWRTLGFIGAGRHVGVTHLTVWTANYLTGAKREKVAVLEWNNHGDFDKMASFCDACPDADNAYKILGADYYPQAGAGKLADCLNGDYGHILIDYGEITGQTILDCARCDLKIIVGSLSEWQAKSFLEAAAAEKKRDASWSYAAAFGSEEARREMEKRFRIRIRRIPGSVDVFAVTRADMEFFSKLLRN